MAGERGLDLAEFDPEAAYLHLLIDPADELDVTVDVPAREVARPVQPATRRHRIGDEPLGGQRWTAEVSTCELLSADVDLADHSGRHELQCGVEDVHRHIAVRHTDRHDPDTLWSVDRVVGGRDNRFGGAVVVAQLGVEHRAELVCDLTGQRFSTHGYLAQGGPLVDPRQQQEHPQHGGNHVHDGDALAHQQVCHVRDILQAVGFGDHQRGPESERAEHLEQRGIEADRRGLNQPVLGGHPELGMEAGEMVRDRRVGYRDTFGPAGGAGGVDDVRQTSREQRADPVRVHRIDDGQGLGCLLSSGQIGLGQHDSRPGVLDEEIDPVLWVGRIDRQVRAARLEHGDRRHDELDRRSKTQCHKVFGSDVA